MTRPVFAVLHSPWVDDQQIVAIWINADFTRFFRDCFTGIPIVKPVLSVVIIQCKQSANPNHRMPLCQPKQIGNALKLIIYDKTAKFGYLPKHFKLVGWPV